MRHSFIDPCLPMTERLRRRRAQIALMRAQPVTTAGLVRDGLAKLGAVRVAHTPKCIAVGAA